MSKAFDLHHGDLFDVLKTLPAESVDSCVTDPPYGISFMGKAWDGTSISEKHGAATVNEAFQAWSAAWGREVYRVLKPGAHLVSFASCRTYHRMTCGLEDAGFEIRDQLAWVFGSGFPKSHNLKGEFAGWGTALKPAWEPIVLGRKPLKGTVQANADKHGTGAVHIEPCRIDFAGAEDERSAKEKNQHGDFMSGPMTNQIYGKYEKPRENYNPPGRWPANLLHDGSEEVTDRFPAQAGVNEARFFYCAKTNGQDREAGLQDMALAEQILRPQRRNIHPTVKPTDLMRWLVRLTTRKGGIVLDPFTGSGSTGRAAVLEGCQFIGCEREAEYIPIARARITEAVGELFA